MSTRGRGLEFNHHGSLGFSLRFQGLIRQPDQESGLACSRNVSHSGAAQKGLPAALAKCLNFREVRQLLLEELDHTATA
jgi:hypothetical protein